MPNLDNIVNFILEEELATPKMAEERGVERTSTFVGPESKQTNDTFFKELSKLKVLRGTKSFDPAFTAFRKKFNPTVAGTNAGDDGRFKELQATFGKDRATNLLLNSEHLSMDEARAFKRAEVERSQEAAKKLVGKEAFDSATPGMQFGLTSLVNNVGQNRASGFKRALSNFREGNAQGFAAELQDSKRGRQLKSRTAREVEQIVQPAPAQQPETLTIPRGGFEQQFNQEEAPIPGLRSQMAPTTVTSPEPSVLNQFVEELKGTAFGTTPSSSLNEVVAQLPQQALDAVIPSAAAAEDPLLQGISFEQPQQQAPADPLLEGISFEPEPQPQADPVLQGISFEAPQQPSNQVQQQAFAPAQAINILPPTVAGPTQGDFQNVQSSLDAAQAARNQINVLGEGLASGATLGLARPVIQAGETAVSAIGEAVQTGSLDPLGADALLERFAEIGEQNREIRDNNRILSLGAEIVGSIPTGRLVVKAAEKGVSLFGLAGRIERAAKAGRVAAKGQLALKGGSLSLDRTRQVHAVVQAAIREQAKNAIIPKMLTEGAASAAFLGGTKAGTQLAETGSVDVADVAKAAGGAALGGAAFGAAATGARVGLSALSKVPKRTTIFRHRDEQRILDEVSTSVALEVKRSVNRGAIRPEQAGAIAWARTMQGLERAGVAIDESFELGLGSKFLRNTEKFNRVDKSLKTKLGEMIHNTIVASYNKANLKAGVGARVHEPIKALEKTGLTPEQITRTLRYFEVDSAGNPLFNPLARGGKNIRAAWENSSTGRALGSLTEEQHRHFQDIRKFFDQEIAKQFPQFAEALGQRKVQGYVPLYTAKGIGRKSQLGSSVEGILDPKSARERATHTGFDSRIHEQNIYKIVDIYASQLAKHEAFAPLLPQIQREVFKLQALGRNDIAQNFTETMARTMNIQTKKEFNAILGQNMGTQIAEANRELIEQVQQRLAPNSPGLFKKVLDSLHQSTFANLLFTNPKTMLKQSVQVPLVGAGEVGAKNMARGQLAWTTQSRVGKLAKDYMPLMRAKDPSALREAVLTPGQELKKLNAALTFVGKPGAFLFNKLDVRNRGAAFSAAYLDFERGLERGASMASNQGRALLEQTMEGMLSSEKGLVIKVLERQGPEAAKRMYSIIRSRRINFAYGIADQPEIFASDIGRMIPFTTWSSNMLMRAIGDVQEGNLRTLAKRVAVPIAALQVFSSLTGLDIPGAVPLSSIPGAFGLQAAPAFSSTAVELAKGGPASAIQEASKFTPIGPLSDLAKNVSRLTGPRGSQRAEGVSRLFGFRASDEPDPLKRLVPKLLREAITKPEQFLPKGLR